MQRRGDGVILHADIEPQAGAGLGESGQIIRKTEKAAFPDRHHIIGDVAMDKAPVIDRNSCV